MAKNKKNASHLKQFCFKPGQSGNPSGRPAVPEHLKQITELTVDEVKRILGKYTRMNLVELKEAIADPATPVLELAIAASLKKAIDEGDVGRINFVLNRSIGKETEKVESKIELEKVEVTKENIAELYEIARKA